MKKPENFNPNYFCMFFEMKSPFCHTKSVSPYVGCDRIIVVVVDMDMSCLQAEDLLNIKICKFCDVINDLER